MKLRFCIIISLLALIAVSLIFGKYEASYDGFTKIGFPFVFYIQFSGKCTICDFKTGFNMLYLAIDILLAVILGLAIYFILVRYNRHKKG